VFADLKKKYSTLFIVAGIIVLVDQVTKEMVMRAFSLHENLEVIPGFFALAHVRNTGGAFGLLAGEATTVRTLIFVLISCLALGIVIYYYSKIASTKPWVAAGLAMIFGGALGNLIDRLRFGEVVDFLDFYIGTAHWPTFNVADSAISVGTAILCFNVVLRKT
jgi:signal peptidase II